MSDAELTDKECEAYRSAPMAFNEMLRKCHIDGYLKGVEDCRATLGFPPHLDQQTRDKGTNHDFSVSQF